LQPNYCGENVLGEGTGCTAMDQVFHVDCFICMTCSCKLRGKPFYAVEKKAYCEPCYIVSVEPQRHTRTHIGPLVEVLLLIYRL
uniref:LIM zinc-binding domain-containing protein n=1 Tax=Astyanax mexicanus TaxID=7994 RepID=A0A8B9KAP1_ASTMX